MISGLVPIGGIIAFAKSFTNVPSLATQGRTEYVECNGQTLSDAQSALTGQVIPNLNNSGGGASNRFLRGNTTSGGTGGSTSIITSSTINMTAASTGTTTGAGSGSLTVPTFGHTHNVPLPSSTTLQTGYNPVYYDVVNIMRVK